MAKCKLMVVIGTRPEAIKLAPLILAARAQPEHFDVCVVRTSQHKEMLDQVMAVFGLVADIDLNIMQPNQDLVHITTASLRGLYDAMAQHQPDWVVVQGDTTTTFAGALAAFYHRIPVAHVEAGLRTGERYLPFPEEINRCLTSRLSDWHFAPTPAARDNLLREGIAAEQIVVTGNTAIDALFLTLQRQAPAAADQSAPDTLLITAHRRENQGPPMAEICGAVLDLLTRYPTLHALFPVHLSPAVRATVMPMLGAHPRVTLVEPLDYPNFVLAMHQAKLILTDSGGVQEEAPSLGKPVLVLRDSTERPEAVAAGTAQLVGAVRSQIVSAASKLLDDPQAYEAMARAVNPFGDGQACARILATLRAAP
ncbi:non-hydrolyzing UDP-N-acetylglucosamine 2-epimerase [Parvibium lacunae]|uniref:UDP-N-acetylglucosamine 2-epimerase (non-hydrolyzing) n=1 Tax=Parvibium lacunae TaxID=1888893 RepID=A0A368KZ83_9BURK|nr:UDP-N-acetylglucosamine 2-epimerase (non-hydrolyzing) [Parvibium lacunae]RCS56673.1 UDP-N-acetylglucosamine 2-epimerase (non-hydrolyzing) [Parvibium lacunae]